MKLMVLLCSSLLVLLQAINNIFKVELVAHSLVKAAPKDVIPKCLESFQMLTVCVETFHFWHLP